MMDEMVELAQEAGAEIPNMEYGLGVIDKALFRTFSPEHRGDLEELGRRVQEAARAIEYARAALDHLPNGGAQ